MSTKRYSLVQGHRMRVTKLDACGRPIYGDDTSVTTEGFVSVATTTNTTETDEINVQNAAGKPCVYQAPKTTFTGYGVELVFCEVDPDLFGLVTNQPAYEDYAGNVIGFAVETGVEASAFALEVWSGVSGGDACENPDAQGEYGYSLFPFLKGGVVSDFTVENNATNFTITGSNSSDGASWGVGPYNVILNGSTPAKLPTALSKKNHLLNIVVDVAPPDGAVGARPTLDPANEALTAIIATPTGANVSLAFTPNDLATEPVWVDWGDGQWSYVTGTVTPAAHTYAADGTYTIKASTNGTWVTDDVTVNVP